MPPTTPTTSARRFARAGAVAVIPNNPSRAKKHLLDRDLYKERHLLAMDDIGMWAVGFIAAFVSAFLCVRWLLRFISTHDFTVFAWYRIAFGCAVLVTWQYGLVDWSTP